MAHLSAKVRIYVEEAGKTVNFGTDVFLQNDGNGSYIKEWNIEGLAQPTDEQLNALEDKANDQIALHQVIVNRKKEYPSIKELVVALYDTEDKAAIDAKRAEIKLKYPKPGA